MAGAFSFIGVNPIANLVSRPNPSSPSFPYRPMMITSQSYWATINGDIESHLKKVIPIKPPLSVFEPMNHLTFAAPTSAAPALCVAACELVGGHRDQAMAAAAALHLMNAASFTHEHLLLTDKPKTKAKHMIEHVYGPNIELLTPDGMIPFGLELLARSDDPTQNNSDQILRVIVEITRTMGSKGIVEGKYYELECNRQSDGKESSHGKWIRDVIEKKEGRFHACGAACGAILGGGSEEEVEKLRSYGLYVGKIQGMLSNTIVENNENGLMEEMEEMRILALKELNDFKGGEVEAISSFVETKFNINLRN